MNNKKNLYYIVAVIIVALIIGAVWRFRAQAPKTEVSPEQSNQNTQQQQSQTKQENTAGSFWQGTLKASDNAQKGNLMLVATGHSVYIRTSRDFSQLIGKTVKVTYSGTLDSFVLGDITAQ